MRRPASSTAWSSASHELVTVFVGATTPDEATDGVGEWLATNRPEVTVEVHRWRLPLSAYLFSIE